MSNGGIIGPVQNPVITPGSAEATTGITSPNPAFAVNSGVTTVTVMVIAGGGAGNQGGGGAGGLRIISNHPVPSSPFPITIGAGGARTPDATNSGTNSIFGSATPITSTGGGGGGGCGGSCGKSGGSGGGSTSTPGVPVAGGTGNSPPFSPPQGNPGGNSSSFVGSGGGGSGGAGSNVSAFPALGGAGGAGTNTAPTFGAAPQPYYPAKSPGPTNAFFAGGGGGGGSINTPVGGTGGGGSGLSAPPASFAQDGDTNSGSGGGGNYGLGAGNAGNGGSGMVIVKQPATSPSITAPGVWSLSDVYDYRKSGKWLGS
jgi:hypothetical protein